MSARKAKTLWANLCRENPRSERQPCVSHEPMLLGWWDGHENQEMKQWEASKCSPCGKLAGPRRLEMLEDVHFFFLHLLKSNVRNPRFPQAGEEAWKMKFAIRQEPKFYCLFGRLIDIYSTHKTDGFPDPLAPCFWATLTSSSDSRRVHWLVGTVTSGTSIAGPCGYVTTPGAAQTRWSCALMGVSSHGKLEIQPWRGSIWCRSVVLTLHHGYMTMWIWRTT